MAMLSSDIYYDERRLLEIALVRARRIAPTLNNAEDQRVIAGYIVELEQKHARLLLIGVPVEPLESRDRFDPNRG